MNNSAADAVERVHQSVTEYWTQLYAESDEDNTRYSIEQGTDLQRQDQYLSMNSEQAEISNTILKGKTTDGQV